MMQINEEVVLYKTEHKTCDFRFVERHVPTYDGANHGSSIKVLQQKIKIVTQYKSGESKQQFNWEDVPTITEDLT